MSVSQLRSLRPVSLVVGLGLLGYAGCSSSATTTEAVTHPTMIEVAPEDFLGSVPCSAGSELKRYVATLIDTDYVAEGGASPSEAASETGAGGAPVHFQLPSSLPTPCIAGVGFGLVVAGRHYDVKIDGYDTDDLVPRASGSRQMVSPALSDAEPVGALATPRWSAHCEDAVAADATIVRADHCTPFKPIDSAAQANLRIDLDALLHGLDCGDEPGQVARFEISLDVGDAQPRLQTVSCEDGAEALFTGLAPSLRASAYIAAFDADGSDAFAGATCTALTLPDASIDAECTSLSQVGTLRVDLARELPLLQQVCEAQTITDVVVTVPGMEKGQSIAVGPGVQPFEHGFAPGVAAVTVTALQSATDTTGCGSLTCGATVAPGQLVVADCQANTAD